MNEHKIADLSEITTLWRKDNEFVDGDQNTVYHNDDSSIAFATYRMFSAREKKLIARPLRWVGHAWEYDCDLPPFFVSFYPLDSATMDPDELYDGDNVERGLYSIRHLGNASPELVKEGRIMELIVVAKLDNSLVVATPYEPYGNFTNHLQGAPPLSFDLQRSDEVHRLLAQVSVEVRQKHLENAVKNDERFLRRVAHDVASALRLPPRDPSLPCLRLLQLLWEYFVNIHFGDAMGNIGDTNFTFLRLFFETVPSAHGSVRIQYAKTPAELEDEFRSDFLCHLNQALTIPYYKLDGLLFSLIPQGSIVELVVSLRAWIFDYIVCDNPHLAHEWDEMRINMEDEDFDKLVNCKDFQLKASFTPAGYVHFFHSLTSTISSHHDNGIAHLDLSSNNVLINSNGQPRVIDPFPNRMMEPASLLEPGEAPTWAPFLMPRRLFGTGEFICPKYFRREANHGVMRDVWSLGMLFAKVLLFLFVDCNPIHFKDLHFKYKQLQTSPSYKAEGCESMQYRKFLIEVVLENNNNDIAGSHSNTVQVIPELRAFEPLVQLTLWLLQPNHADRPKSLREVLAQGFFERTLEKLAAN